MFTKSAFVAIIPRLRGFARNLTRDVDRAEDLLQSTLLRGWERQEQFEEGTNLYGWLARMMFTINIDSGRASMRRGRVDPLDEKHDIAAHPSPTAILEAREALRLLLQFAPKRRHPLLWMALGYSHHEIAVLMDIAPGTVLSRACRTRAQLCREAA